MAGFIDSSFLQTTKLLTPVPSDYQPMVLASTIAGAALGLAPIALVVGLGGSGQVIWRNGMTALGAVPASMFVMHHFASRVAADELFRGGPDSACTAECRVSSFGGRSRNNAHVDCYGMGGIDLEISQSEYERLNAARAQRTGDAALEFCYRLTVQTSGRNMRLVLPSLSDATQPQLISCKEKAGS